MAVLLAMFIAKLFSFAGLGGLILGLFSKNWPRAAGAGVVMGVVDTLILETVRYTTVEPISWIMAIMVAVLMSTLGWWMRGRKRA